MTLLMLAQSASALSCIWGVYDSNAQDVDLPRNASIVFLHTDIDLANANIRLLGTGDEVAIELEVTDQYIRVTPTEMLAPGTYELTSDNEGLAGRTLTVGDTIDEEAPDVPEITKAKRVWNKTGWGTSKGVSVEVTEQGPGVLYEYQISQGSWDEAETIIDRASAFLGSGLCTTNFEGYQSGQFYQVRVRALDNAGNTSEWTEGIKAASRLGCSTSTASGSFALVLMGLFGLRRRR